MKLYFIYDVVSSSVARTLTFPGDDVCLRFLDSALRVPNSPFVVNAKDTILVEVGIINEESLKINIESSQNIKNEIDVISPYTGDITQKVYYGRRVNAYDDLIKSFFGGSKNDKKEKDVV